jgi:hypothetical protein
LLDWEGQNFISCKLTVLDKGKEKEENNNIDKVKDAAQWGQGEPVPVFLKLICYLDPSGSNSIDRYC